MVNMSEHKTAAREHIRRTIAFSSSMHKQIISHAEKYGCRTFSEAVRDLIRTVLSGKDAESGAAQGDNFQQSIIEKAP